MREMKNSELPWIGDMPSNWKLTKGKYCLKYLQKPIQDDDGVITCFRDGEVTLRSKRREEGFTMSDKEIGYQGIDVGDLVVHGMDGFAGAIGVSDSRGKASPVLNVLDTEENKKFFMYYLRSMAYGDVFLALATGIRVRSCDLRWNKLAELSYPIPPIEEQKRIAEYIETKCSEIDALSADIQSKIDTLEAYKRSVITEAVTKGLDKNVPMKDSGIIEIGKIPCSWRKSKTKYVAQISIGLVTTMTAHYVDSLENGVYLIRNGDIRLNKIEPNGMVYISKDFVDRNSNRKLKIKDIVTVHTGYVGTSALIDEEYEGSVGFATIQSRPNLSIVNERFLCWYYNSNAFIEQCMSHNTGDGRQNLNLYDFVDFWVILPPPNEQDTIADYLDTKCSEIDEIINDLNKELIVLEEYKKSIIYEYVTGKKEVPV